MQRSSTIATATQNPSKFKLEPISLKSNRSNSAQANLQSHPCFQSSLFNDKERAAGSIKTWKERLLQDKLPSLYENNSDATNKDKKDYQLENIIWTESVKQSRRLTLTNTQNITEWEIVLLKRQRSYAIAAMGDKGKLEEKLSLDALNELQMAFNLQNPENGGTLELDEFKEVVRTALQIQGRNDDEITSLFMKINFTSDGKITWQEFCTFMQLNFTEKEDHIKRQKEVVFITPARTENSPHRHPVQKIIITSDSNYMIMSSDGVVSFWSPTGELKRIKKDIIEKRTVVKDKGDKQDSKRNRPKWITDFIILNEFNKIVVGTGDRELQFWELSSFDPYCQIYSLHTVPIKLAYNYSDRDDVTITYGDTDGCVNILMFSSIGETLRIWKAAPLVAQMPSVHLDKALEAPNVKYNRWKTHNDWIEQIRIDRRLNQIISCSNDDNYALVIGCISPSTDVASHINAATGQNQTTNEANITQTSTNTAAISNVQSVPSNANQTNRISSAATPINQQYQQSGSSNNAVSSSSLNVKRRPEVNETVFKVNKGVKTFDFSFEKNLLITGGMDRVVRLYNPYVPGRPIAHLKSHITPIFFIHLSNEDNRIFTMSTDKSLNVWDLVDHSCLANLRPKTHKINGELQSCCFNPKTKSLLINSDKISFLSLKLKSTLHTEVVLSHKEPVTCFLYNKEFKQLISCTDNGTVKLWDVETGKGIFEFSNAHNDQAITCMTFDDTNRRLITGSRDGTCKIWNFNNGHCLKILRKDNTQEINDVKYTKIYNNKFIVSVGWDRRINIYDDEMNDVKVYSDPIAQWVDDIENGHKEDILCIAKSGSNFLATSSYDGEIIVWNMVSGHIFCKLNSPKPHNYRDENLDGDLSVNKLIFLNKDSFSEKSAHLISSGPWGMVHFWNVFTDTEIYAQFPVGDKKGTNITKMCVDSKYSRLFAADNHGYIYNWNINDYAVLRKEKEPPFLIRCWRAHCENINAIEYIESSRILITGSSDLTIRAWSPDGKYIGTFGQDEIWNLYDIKTYKHPLVPYDILIDEESLPEHPILNTKETMEEVLEKNKLLDKQENESEFGSAILSNSSKYTMIDDDSIIRKIRDMNILSDKVGKRLRHEIMKPAALPDKGAKNYYQMLKCYDYDDSPVGIKTPQAVLNKNKNENRYY